MSRLIDADFACKGCIRYRTSLPCEECVVNDATTVDAVPVVRCRECKHLGFCGDATNLEVMGFYGYCSRGERKEGADNDT